MPPRRRKTWGDVSTLRDTIASAEQLTKVEGALLLNVAIVVLLGLRRAVEAGVLTSR